MLYRALLSTVLAVGCVAPAIAAAETPGAQRTSQAEVAFERLKALQGEWIDVSGSSAGKGKVAAMFKVTSGGSAVMETVFPGTNHEMVSIYTREGNSIVMAHYCAMGNQPRMRAIPDGSATLRFAFDGGGNLDPQKDSHMHEGLLRFGGDTHHAEWKTFANGKPSAHRAVFELQRKAGPD